MVKQVNLLKSHVQAYQQTKITKDWNSLWALVESQLDDKWPITLTDRDMEEGKSIKERRREHQKVSVYWSSRHEIHSYFLPENEGLV